MTTPHDAPYKQLQATARERMQQATLLVPTLPTRINRLNPAERHEVTRIIRSMKLRKVIRRVLAEAHWNREAEQVASMQGLRRLIRSHEQRLSYERNLIASVDATTFIPQITQTGESHG